MRVVGDIFPNKGSDFQQLGAEMKPGATCGAAVDDQTHPVVRGDKADHAAIFCKPRGAADGEYGLTAKLLEHRGKADAFAAGEVENLTGGGVMQRLRVANMNRAFAGLAAS